MEKDREYGSDYDSDAEISDEKLSKLLDTVSSLDGNQSSIKKVCRRTEPAIRISEFGLYNGGKANSKVKIHELMKSVKDSSGKIRQQIRKISHKKLIDTPLETPKARELHRKVIYEESGKEISKWEPVVEQFKEKPQVEFPLEKPELSLVPAHRKLQQIKPKTDLEKAICEALGKSENSFRDDRVLTKAEEKYLKSMSLEEARERHRQLQKMRALLSYQEAKLKRRAKIKSKKYHRILKKDKIKQELKDFENLKEKDPEKALEKLDKLERLRALERASLKHMKTGKWSKHNKLRAKYDLKAREALAEQVEVNRRLMTKAKVEPTKDSPVEEIEDEEFGENEEMMGTDEFETDRKFDDNPWLGRRNSVIPKTSSIYEQKDDEIQELIDLTSTEERNKVEEKLAISEISQITAKSEPAKPFFLSNPLCSTLTTTLIEKVYPLDATEKTKNNFSSVSFKSPLESKPTLKSTEKLEEENKSISIDPKQVLEVKTKRVGFTFPKLQMSMNESEEESDEEDDRRKIIAEAFAGDDVIVDFMKEKKAKIEKEGGKDICNYLPGWGHWSGPGLKESKKLKLKFTIKAKKKKRTDDKLGNVIISEEGNRHVKKLMVKNLPFNCKRTSDFEKVLKKPVGCHWNLETKFRSTIEPRVVTGMGKIIEPINEKFLIRKPLKPHRKPLDQVSRAADLIPI